MADAWDRLSPKDQAKLRALQIEWDRDGLAALERFMEREPTTYLRIIALFNPKAVRDAIEDAVIDAGLTDTDILAMLEKSRWKQ
jgi:hypothetical protein